MGGSQLCVATLTIQFSDRIDVFRRNPADGARIVDAEEQDAARGVRERGQPTGGILRVGRNHASVSKAYFLELGAAVFPGAKLVQNLLPGVEHGPTLPAGQSEMHAGACSPRSQPQSTRRHTSSSLRYSNKSVWPSFGGAPVW